MSQSSDPYLFARLTPRTPPSSEHPPFPLTFRTSTLRHTRDPEWNETWHLGGIPPEGFELQVKILDEDKPGDYDDGLGVASLSVTQLPSGSNDGGAGEAREYTVKIMKRKASRRAYAATYISAWCSGDFKKQRGRVDRSYGSIADSSLRSQFRISESQHVPGIVPVFSVP